jgi:hypothetical protein
MTGLGCDSFIILKYNDRAMQGRRSGSKSVCVGGGTLSVRQKRVTFKGVRGRAREKILKLESLKSHFLHFRRRFTILFML